MGCPIEIEFAVNINQEENVLPILAILQIRPLVPSNEQTQISWDEDFDKKGVLIHSNKALGNGLIKSIKDVVYVPPDLFDSTKTIEIAKEIDKLNQDLIKSKKPFILIGPGRWGTEDRFLGVPVKWNQISGVRVMVETALENFVTEPSQGTHFFHNITSRGIGYINVPYNSKEYFIDWRWLEEKQPIKSLKFVKHIELDNYLTIKLDGRKSCALIEK
jgi:hypothetical protein